MTKKEFESLKNGEYITAIIKNKDTIKIDIFKYEYCEYRTITDKGVFIRGLNYEYKDLMKTKENDFELLEKQEIIRHQKALNRIDAQRKDFKK